MSALTVNKASRWAFFPAQNSPAFKRKIGSFVRYLELLDRNDILPDHTQLMFNLNFGVIIDIAISPEIFVGAVPPCSNHVAS